jgi:uncharacterized protein (DUF1499 family)
MTGRPRLERTTYLLGIAAPLLALLGAYGSGWGFWPFTTGFLFLGIALLAALAALICGIIGWRLNRPAGGSGGFARFGMLLAFAFVAVMAALFWRAGSSPRIHDVTTDSADPPAFETLTLRKDNLIGVGTIENWRKIHDEGYADIRPVVLAMPPAEAMKKAKALVEARGWEIASADDGRIEATETASPFAFKDDVVIIATPENGGAATRIDMRSVSRVGLSDLGVNAERVRGFLNDLQSAE